MIDKNKMTKNKMTKNKMTKNKIILNLNHSKQNIIPSQNNLFIIKKKKIRDR